MNAQTNLPAERKDAAPLVVLKEQLSTRLDSFREALPSHIKPEELQRTAVMAAQQNPALLTADRRSFIMSCMKSAQDGLLPDGREAALVPFSVRKKGADGQWHSHQEVQYMPMVYGLRKKIMQSDEISTMQVGVVYRKEYESGRFLFDLGMDPPLRYKPDLMLTGEEVDDSQIIAGWSLVRFKDGSHSAEVMRRGEIDKIQNLSQTGSTKDYKGNRRDPKGPWADHYSEMVKKTVMRRHSKVLPMSGDIFRDVEGSEVELAARSAVKMLEAVEADAPVVIPTDDEIDRLEAHDPETGEVNPQTGMTELSEDEARALDAQTGEGQDDTSPAEEFLTKIRGGIKAAKLTSYLDAVEEDWEQSIAAYDEAVVNEIDGLIEAKRAELMKKGAK